MPFFFLAVFLFPLSAFASFPCDLSDAQHRQRPLPTLVLNAEIHGEEFSDIDKDLHLLEGKAGTLFVGLEGIDQNHRDFRWNKLLNAPDFLGIVESVDPEKMRVFGIDSLFPKGIATLLIYNYFLNATALEKPHDLPRVIDTTRNELLISTFFNPYLQEALKRFKETAKPNPEQTEILTLLTSFEKSEKTSEQLKSLSGKIPANHPINRVENLNWIFVGLGMEYSKMAQSEKYRVQMKTPENIHLFLDILQAQGQAKKSLYRQASDAIVVHWRNHFMAENLAKLYCRALAEGKNTVGIVGEFHAPGLQALLTTLSQGRVPVLVRNSSDSGKLFQQWMRNPAGTIEHLMKTHNHCPTVLEMVKTAPDEL